MSSRRLFHLPLPFYEANTTRANKSMSEDCLRRLKYAVQIMDQIDLTVLDEWRTLMRTWAAAAQLTKRSQGPEWGVSADEKQQLEDLNIDLAARQSLIMNESGIKDYLSRRAQITSWRVVSTVMFRALNHREFDRGFGLERRNRAEAILELGESLITNLKSIKLELQMEVPDVIFAIRLRLTLIKSFHPAYKDILHTNKEVSHPFIVLMQDFNTDATAPKNIVEAYPMVDKSIQSTLIAVTLIALTVSIVPTYFAWQRSATEAGTKNEADFWVGLQALFVQLLSLFTMMWPVSRFAPVVAWRFSWVFTALAGVCALAVPVLYVTVPIGWSVLTAYFASAAQATVVLQVMLGSNYARKKQA